MKNKKQKNKIDFDKEFRRLGVFIEHVDSNVGLIAEQHGDIKKILDSHTEILDSHTEILDSHTEILDSHTEMIGKLAVDLEIVKGDVKTTKIDIEIIKTDIELIKNSVKKKIDADEFAALERRVLILEKHR